VNIVVCVKQVPDTTAKKEYDANLRFNRAALDSVVNPFDEYAIEEALRLKEAGEAQLTVLTMGPPGAEETMRKALAMGADRGVLVTDPELAGSDWLATAKVLAAALGRIGFDLILTGMESTDARTGLVPGGIAELLQLPCLSYASKLDVADGAVRIDRQIPGGYQQVEARLPAVVSVVKGVNEPRYPSLKGIMAAKRKEIARMGLADLELSGDHLGYDGAKARLIAVTPRPTKEAGRVIRGESAEDAARQVADFLAEKKFI